MFAFYFFYFFLNKYIQNWIYRFFVFFSTFSQKNIFKIEYFPDCAGLVLIGAIFNLHSTIMWIFLPTMSVDFFCPMYFYIQLWIYREIFKFEYIFPRHSSQQEVKLFTQVIFTFEYKSILTIFWIFNFEYIFPH